MVYDRSQMMDPEMISIITVNAIAVIVELVE